MVTVWKQIPNFESYEASTDGNIRNFKTKKLLARCGKGDGYLYITMYHNKKYHNRSIHTMVARAFLPNPESKPTVNHIDKNGLNNELDNLEWATYSEQQKHILSFGPRVKPPKRESAIHIEGEVWKVFIEGYSISSYGRVKNGKGFLLKLITDKRGYVSLYLKGKMYSIHRLVADKYIGFENGKQVVNHKDGNKSNNFVTNLEVVSQSVNIKHAYEMGLNINITKRCVYQVDYKGNIVGTYESLTLAESMTKYNRGCIHNAIESRCTSHGYRWFDNIDEIVEEKKKKLLCKNFFKVIQCDEEGTLINVYDSYPIATEATHVSVSNISRSCKTRLKAGGFKWFQCYADYIEHFPQQN
jgi:hypothetical protein